MEQKVQKVEPGVQVHNTIRMEECVTLKGIIRCKQATERTNF